MCSVPRQWRAIILIALLNASLSPATAKISSAPAIGGKKFQVDGKVFTGTPTTNCLIKGAWSDGSAFRYEAWDTCRAMHMKRVKAADFAGAPALGIDDHYEVSDIPPGSEVLWLSNYSSTVLLFRDNEGITREILIGD